MHRTSLLLMSRYWNSLEELELEFWSTPPTLYLMSWLCSGQLWQMWQWTGTRVYWWRASRKIKILNLQSLSQVPRGPSGLWWIVHKEREGRSCHERGADCQDKLLKLGLRCTFNRNWSIVYLLKWHQGDLSSKFPKFSFRNDALSWNCQHRA